jgi:hypothetical protein
MPGQTNYTVSLNDPSPALSITADGKGETPEYHWQSSTTGVGDTWADISANAETTSYNAPTSPQGTTYYRCRVRNGCDQIFSGTFTVVVQYCSGYTIQNGVFTGTANVAAGDTYTNVLSKGYSQVSGSRVCWSPALTFEPMGYAQTVAACGSYGQDNATWRLPNIAELGYLDDAGYWDTIIGAPTVLPSVTRVDGSYSARWSRVSSLVEARLVTATNANIRCVREM